MVSLSSYRFGYDLETTFDVTFSNSSLVDTVPYIQLTESQLLAQIDGLRGKGYSVVSISGRVAADGLLYYTGVFRISAPIMETKVYLRDSLAAFQGRLKDMQGNGYQLVAQSLEMVSRAVVACSVFTRDRRLDYNISIDQKPLRWISLYNVSFYEFTNNILNNVRSFLPAHIDSYYIDSSDSVFSVVLLERTADIVQWFQWGLNDSYTRVTLKEKVNWDPIIALGYSYYSDHQHYLQWKQKSPPEYIFSTTATSFSEGC